METLVATMLHWSPVFLCLFLFLRHSTISHTEPFHTSVYLYLGVKCARVQKNQANGSETIQSIVIKLDSTCLKPPKFGPVRQLTIKVKVM